MTQTMPLLMRLRAWLSMAPGATNAGVCLPPSGPGPVGAGRAGCFSLYIKAWIAGCGIFALTALASGAEPEGRVVMRSQIPDTREVIVVAEGDLEPRSLGSYALRVYGGASKKFPTDDFVAGVIRPRNGTVEALRFADVAGDERPEIVVVVRSAGSGAYLSADAFRYLGRSLEYLGSVTDLDKGADPVRALRARLKQSGARNG